ncbi:hypothetical protein R3Q06_12865 [Rhodococcus erythropolis]|uniref:hypothetical protein n=1 Tax=Rhodococcus erythropolis TaxID=1833 RepID=UPI0029493480|nr:hypothetical protein [Rhodococcus erythropolis]MDV6274395.1 hypothetical protein [Rhodococcus erythropolis]
MANPSDCLWNLSGSRESLPTLCWGDNPRVEGLLVTQVALKHLAGPSMRPKTETVLAQLPFPM